MNEVLNTVTAGINILMETDNNLYVGRYKGENREVLFSLDRAKKSMWDEFDVFTANGAYNGSLVRVCDELVPEVI